MLHSQDIEECRRALEAADARKVAFVYHFKICDPNGYQVWLGKNRNRFGGKRLFRVRVDPVPREGMLIDEIIIEEYPSPQVAIAGE